MSFRVFFVTLQSVSHLAVLIIAARDKYKTGKQQL